MSLLQLAAASRQTFDATCASFTQGPATTQATQGPTTTDDTPNDACLAALNTLTNNVATCTATPQNPTVICEGVCRGYFDDIFDSCPDAVSLLTVVCSYSCIILFVHTYINDNILLINCHLVTRKHLKLFHHIAT